MQLKFNILSGVFGVNQWFVADSFAFGQSAKLYVQIASELEIRYMLLAGTQVEVQLNQIDDSKTVKRLASKAFVNDDSVYVIDLLPTDAALSVDVILSGATVGTLSTDCTVVSNPVNSKFFC